MKPSQSSYKEIRLILGDQLNHKHSWFNSSSKDVLYVMMEIKPESEYVTHHIQKIVGIFLNMRNFASELSDQGHEFKYFKITDEDNEQSFQKNLEQLVKEYTVESASYQEPDEYRLDKQLKAAFENIDIPFKMISTEHFLTERDTVKEMFKGKKQYLMERFYRTMRKETQVLMEDDEPLGGEWNYDKQNRKKLPKDTSPPEPITFSHDVTEILDDIESAGLEHIGEISPDQFIWPASRKEALEVVDFFLENLLVHFGDYQDALADDYWSLYHSRISFAMNMKLIDPKEVIEKVETYWQKHQDEVHISQTEGFIRQILGWREFMRGVYWAKMPSYESLNFFEHDQKLPSYFWSGKTKMNCIAKSVRQSLEYGYAHHIQRLMVTGNFSLLMEVDPDEVDSWYLGIYTDAYQWVEITNTRGMSQFADGGIIGTKPYISSASYINKMGDYCKGCHYKHSKRTGSEACPFNSLYWRFIATHEAKLSDNPRMSMMYRLWHKMDQETKNEILDQADDYFNNRESL